MSARQHIVCDRCKSVVRNAMKDCSGCTGGYYEVAQGYWHQFANPGETYLCDPCMFADERYRAVYGVHTDERESQP